ncbi:hypothetical protein CLV97_12840 [Planifilum fimeticola]|jgi:hypothetical protein|uniref:Uncharacterized protein n=1 Tax=Planifilum fimeticola TaxID=201975 RepID=A0A2T0LBC0_9BACL|nr:hypothetical protein [Planifilum fimeticola]PRX39204.1 hypothetical protein CLV97_12840 [Planifilum fimeticola]
MRQKQMLAERGYHAAISRSHLFHPSVEKLPETGVGTSGSPSGKPTSAPGRPARFRKDRPRAGGDAEHKQADDHSHPDLDEWLQRFLELFLQTNEKPDWVSTDLKQPAFVTITTYQALHSLFKTEKETEEADAAEEMETGAEGGGEGWEEVSSAPEARFIREKMESIGCG